jgi:hypothetical protein
MCVVRGVRTVHVPGTHPGPGTYVYIHTVVQVYKLKEELI